MNNDLNPQTYQDDLDTNKTDPIANEYGADPVKQLNIPEERLKEELDKIALDDTEKDKDDMRETIEDRDENDDSSAANA